MKKRNNVLQLVKFRHVQHHSVNTKKIYYINHLFISHIVIVASKFVIEFQRKAKNRPFFSLLIQFDPLNIKTINQPIEKSKKKEKRFDHQQISI